LAGGSGGITITMTPAVEYGVVVGTSSFAFTISTAGPSVTATPVPIQIVGSLQPVELNLCGSITSSSTPWTLASTLSSVTNQLDVYAVFLSSSQVSPPPATDFTGNVNRLVTNTPQRAGGVNGIGTGYEDTNNLVPMDNLSVGDQRTLWFLLEAPPATTTARPQTLSVTITATTSNL
jgi:hypothetical protein